MRKIAMLGVIGALVGSSMAEVPAAEAKIGRFFRKIGRKVRGGIRRVRGRTRRLTRSSVGFARSRARFLRGRIVRRTRSWTRAARRLAGKVRRAPRRALGRVRAAVGAVAARIRRGARTVWARTAHLSRRAIAEIGTGLRRGYAAAVRGAKGALRTLQATLRRYIAGPVKDALLRAARGTVRRLLSTLRTLRACGNALFGASSSTIARLVKAIVGKRIETPRTRTDIARLSSSPEFQTCFKATVGRWKSLSLGLAAAANYAGFGAEAGLGYVIDLRANPGFRGWFALGPNLSVSTGGPGGGVGEQLAIWTADSAGFAGPYLSAQMSFPLDEKGITFSGVQVYFGVPRHKSQWLALVKDPSKVVDLFPLLGVGVAVGIQTASPYVTAAVSGGFTWTLPPYTLAQ